MNSTPLAGQVAVVTGAGRNIGRAIALALADAGARVAVNVRASRDEGDAVVAAIAAQRGEAMLCVADVTDRAQVDAMVAAVLARHGRIDLLVNNAAIRQEAAFGDMSFDTWRVAQSVCVDGAFHCTQAALPALQARGGSVVNIGGMTAATGAAHRAHVVTAKAAIGGLTRALAHELAPFGITVNCVSPGLIDTIRDGALPHHHRTAVNALRRRGTPDEVAAAVCYLCGPAARYVTGQMLHVNGGAWMG